MTGKEGSEIEKREFNHPSWSSRYEEAKKWVETIRLYHTVDTWKKNHGVSK